jgi:hypothetical protein
MTSKLKTDVLETVSGSGTIALTNQLSGMTTASLPALGSAQMPSGSVIQVLTNKGSAGLSLTSGTFITTGMSLAITPSSSSNKILAMFLCQSVTTLAANTSINVHLRRSGTDVSKVNYYTAQQGGNQTVPVGTMHTLDSPNTTSEITYEVFVQEGGVSGTVQINGPLELTLMEIQG